MQTNKPMTLTTKTANVISLTLFVLLPFVNTQKLKCTGSAENPSGISIRQNALQYSSGAASLTVNVNYKLVITVL